MAPTHVFDTERFHQPAATRSPQALNDGSSVIQAFHATRSMPLGLDEETRRTSIDLLNPLLADTITLRDLYKKHHWQVSGPTFYQLHLLYDKHAGELDALIDTMGERIQLLGGVTLVMAHDIAETTRIVRPPRGREDPAAQLRRLVAAHEQILVAAREAADQTAQSGDSGSNDFLVSSLIRTNELQVWFIHEHLFSVPLVSRWDGASEGDTPQV